MRISDRFCFLFRNCGTALAGFVVLIRMDRRDDQPLFWSQTYNDPSSNNYLQLEWESNQAVSSVHHQNF